MPERNGEIYCLQETGDSLLFYSFTEEIFQWQCTEQTVCFQFVMLFVRIGTKQWHIAVFLSAICALTSTHFKPYLSTVKKQVCLWLCMHEYAFPFVWNKCGCAVSTRPDAQCFTGCCPWLKANLYFCVESHFIVMYPVCVFKRFTREVVTCWRLHEHMQ